MFYHHHQNGRGLAEVGGWGGGIHAECVCVGGGGETSLYLR